MKNLVILFLLLSTTTAFSQSLPINFEGDIETTDFIDFDGGMATVIENPQVSGINESGTVAQIVRNGGAIWSGSKIALEQNLDFSTSTIMSMKVFTTAPVGTNVKFKLEGNGATERDTKTTVSGEWETLTWDFTGAPTNFNEVVFMFDFGNVGDGSSNSTFLFDDVELLFGGEQLDLPVTFEEDNVNYTLIDFEGAFSVLAEDPEDATNTVGMAIKGAGAGASSGTTIGTNGGFVSEIDLTLTDSEMTVRVWSPTVNTPIRLKVEDASDPTHTCETQTNTTTANAWETIVFDFANEASGTAALSFGLDNGWIYNKASIFFNFGTEGNAANEQTYYFDDIQFGNMILNTQEVGVNTFTVYPSPANAQWNVVSAAGPISQVLLYDMHGRFISQNKPKGEIVSVDCGALESGVYVLRVVSEEGIGYRKVVRE